MTNLEDAVRDTVNGLRADLHDPKCPGMDEDGNWLGPCDCAEQHAGMPAIIFSDEAHRQWMDLLDGLADGYYARCIVQTEARGSGVEEVTLEGHILRTERVGEFPALVLGLPLNREVVIPSEDLVSVYLV